MSLSMRREVTCMLWVSIGLVGGRIERFEIGREKGIESN